MFKRGPVTLRNVKHFDTFSNYCTARSWNVCNSETSIDLWLVGYFVVWSRSEYTHNDQSQSNCNKITAFFTKSIMRPFVRKAYPPKIVFNTGAIFPAMACCGPNFAYIRHSSVATTPMPRAISIDEMKAPKMPGCCPPICFEQGSSILSKLFCRRVSFNYDDLINSPAISSLHVGNEDGYWKRKMEKCKV